MLVVNLPTITGKAAWNWRRAVLSADAGLLVINYCNASTQRSPYNRRTINLQMTMLLPRCTTRQPFGYNSSRLLQVGCRSRQSSEGNSKDRLQPATRISCHWQTCPTLCIMVNVLRTNNVDAQNHKLVTERSWQRFASKVANFQLPHLQ